jgi:hypothetical protein
MRVSSSLIVRRGIREHERLRLRAASQKPVDAADKAADKQPHRGQRHVKITLPTTPFNWRDDDKPTRE